MMDNVVRHLDWDSNFFGYKVAELQCRALTPDQLQEVVLKLKADNYKLIYCLSQPDDLLSNNTLASAGVLLADKKVTFHQKLTAEVAHSTIADHVMSYNSNFVSGSLLSMALQSGLYSRFRIDLNFINGEFERLYKEWITLSVTRTLCREVLVYKLADREAGFITLKTTGTTGSIGLIAVDETARGASVGKLLVNSALAKFREYHMDTVEVVTQSANVIACNFYTKLGFEVKNYINIFHLWIK